MVYGGKCAAHSRSPAFSLTVNANLLTVAIVIRGRCGLSKCISRYLLSMALADLMVLVVNVTLEFIKPMYFPGSFLDITPVCSIIFYLGVVAIDCSVSFTVLFTFDRFIAICFQKFKVKYCTEKTATVIITSVCVISLALNVGFCFIFEPAKVIDTIPMFCVVKSTFYTSPLWVAYYWLRVALTPLVPFVLIALLNALTIRHITRASRIRRELRGSGKGESHSDPEIENRRKSIILLLAISGSFILLWAVNVVHKICITITDAVFFQKYVTSVFNIIRITGLMLQSLSSCTNTVIYAVAQTKFRAEMLTLIKSPYDLMHSLTKLCLNKCV
ncbi:probable G-protein coupled receptor 139 [Leucoraja erinacea]|uniref:probable G-protein coupled receptor 139 n=1 Tax=Leucoraja erinaceus TaxID=7782 RepID=UPI0024588F14|nr:probable G-protein coupled receptor 139 [Leucoraja erinacea]